MFFCLNQLNTAINVKTSATSSATNPTYSASKQTQSNSTTIASEIKSIQPSKPPSPITSASTNSNNNINNSHNKPDDQASIGNKSNDLTSSIISTLSQISNLTAAKQQQPPVTTGIASTPPPPPTPLLPLSPPSSQLHSVSVSLSSFNSAEGKKSVHLEESPQPTSAAAVISSLTSNAQLIKLIDASNGSLSDLVLTPTVVSANNNNISINTSSQDYFPVSPLFFCFNNI
jgi:hypothetical protein